MNDRRTGAHGAITPIHLGESSTGHARFREEGPSETRSRGGVGALQGSGEPEPGHGQPIFLVLSLEMMANLDKVSKIKIVPTVSLQYFSLRLICC